MNISKALLRSTLIVFLLGALSACGDSTTKSADGKSDHGQSHE
ncbi:hypothetical protein [Pseudomonas sp. ICMP 561]|nr:hypothetical protein [Pseudomonas sp. ICMP 561]